MVENGSKMTFIWLLIIASMAGELPLNGTWVILMPSAALNASVTSWYELPEVP